MLDLETKVEMKPPQLPVPTVLTMNIPGDGRAHPYRRRVDEALRLLIRLRRQQDVGAAFGKYRWRGGLARSRSGAR
jgi:hypothetical protein